VASARQGMRCLGQLHRHARHRALNQGPDLLWDRQEDGSLYAVLECRRSEARPMPNVTSLALPSHSTQTRATGTLLETPRPSFFRDPLRFSDLTTQSSAIRDPGCVRPTTTGISSRSCSRHRTKSLSPCLIADCRAVGHMHGIASHTYSMLDAENHGVWSCISKASRALRPDRCRSCRSRGHRPREPGISSRRSRPETSQVKAIPAGDDGEAIEIASHNPFDVTKVWSKTDYPFVEVGVTEINRDQENYSAEWSSGLSLRQTSFRASVFRQTGCFRRGCSPIRMRSASA
jgi:hypothetical protein